LIVVDTHVLASLLLPGPRTEQAEVLLLAQPQWATPRSGAANGATCSPVICGAICVASEQVLQLATSSRCRAYDCKFVAAAQQLGVP
jgi:predicted nucleic acid-binding protein